MAFGAEKNEVRRMRRNLGMAMAVVFLAFLIPLPASAKSEYRTPEITRAGDIQFPANAVKAGIVTLAVNLDARGAVTRLDALRSSPALTDVAAAAVRTWGFAPATLDGQAIPSVLIASVVFNSFSPAGVSNLPAQIPLSSITPATYSGYVPPEITTACFAASPVNSVAAGAVVLDVSIGKTGELAKVEVVRGVPALTQQALKAIRSWSFLPATFKGRAILSRMAVSFVFAPPGSVNY